MNQEIYNDYIRHFERDIDNMDSLGSLKIHNYNIPLTNGVGTLPDDYARLIGKPKIADELSNLRYVDLVTAFEHGSREGDFLTRATTTHPTCMIGGVDAYGLMQIRLTPATITSVWIDYIKGLSVPFLDYYMNKTTFNYTFLDDTATLQTIPVDCIYRDGTAGTGLATTVSLTNNFDWHEDDLSLLLTKLVNRLAKQLPDELLIQTSDKEQDKSDAE